MEVSLPVGGVMGSLVGGELGAVNATGQYTIGIQDEITTAQQTALADVLDDVNSG